MSDNPEAALARGFPHSYRFLNVRGLYRRLSIALLVPVGAGVYLGGASAFFMVLSAVIGAIAADLLAVRLLRAPAFDPVDFRALSIGLTMAALLSPDTSPLVAAGSAALAVIVGVWLFGGPGRYRVHPALIGPALLGVAFPGMQAVREGGAGIAVPLPGEFIARLEQVVFEPLGVRLSLNAWALLLGGSGPDGGALVLGLVGPVLLGALILFGEDVLPAVLPLSFLVTYSFLVWVFGGVPDGLGAGNPLDAVFLTNAPFVMLFLPADPSVRPATRTGMAAFGVLSGALGALLWITGAVAVPAVVAFFLSGIFVAVLDSLTTRRM